MFDIGFSELLVVFVVALIILGPERLPTAAKTAGLWIRKIRRTISSVQREINAQLDQEELQQKITQTNQRILKEGNDIQNMITPLPERVPTSDTPTQADDAVLVESAEAQSPDPVTPGASQDPIAAEIVEQVPPANTASPITNAEQESTLTEKSRP